MNKDHFISIRGQVGSRLSALDTADAARENQKVDTASALSDLQDLDYADALARIADSLSNRPRKALGYMTPAEKLAEVLALTP